MTRYALVPVEPTREMTDAWSTAYPAHDPADRDRWTDKDCAKADWSAMLAASPGGGRVTAEQRIRAAIALYAAQEGATEESCARLFRGDPGEHCGDCTKVAGTCIRCLREQILAEVDAVIRGLGLQVEGDGQEGEGK